MNRLVCALGYLRLGAADLAAWRRLATDVLGLAVARDDDAPPDAAGAPESVSTLRLRGDDRLYRLELCAAEKHAVLGVGWELPGAAALEAVREHAAAHRVLLEHADRDLCDRRGVSEMLAGKDPAGIPVEFFWGPRLARQPFVSPRGVRFVMGELGLGHVVFAIPRARYAAQIAFYEALGFRLSDRFRVGSDDVRFLHCNGRHHSLALGERDTPVSLVHFMLEAAELDAVGLALDAAYAGGARVKRALGRHTNDRMVSFYAETPSGFDVEYGWGGRLVDDARWSAAEVPGGTLWGHRPAG